MNSGEMMALILLLASLTTTTPDGLTRALKESVDAPRSLCSYKSRASHEPVIFNCAINLCKRREKKRILKNFRNMKNRSFTVKMPSFVMKKCQYYLYNARQERKKQKVFRYLAEIYNARFY